MKKAYNYVLGFNCYITALGMIFIFPTLPFTSFLDYVICFLFWLLTLLFLGVSFDYFLKNV